MIPLPVAEIARVVQAAAPVDGGPLVSGDVVVDSRLAGPGDLFVALPGERVDGHDFAVAAVRAGAVAVVAARDVGGLGVPVLRVADPLVALQALAAHVFGLDQPLTFGITGSSGKTSTKDLLAHLLGEGTLAPAGSYNNELGLPLTLLRRTPDTACAVLEYSARGVGHIAFLTGLARPHVAVELNVGTAHLGEFGSREAIAAAKGELVEAVQPRGDGPPVVVLNDDDPLVRGMRDRAPEGARVVRYGYGADVDVRAEDVRLDDGGRPGFLLRTSGGSAEVRLQLLGEHAVHNALAAAAAALHVHELHTVAARLETARPVSRWRMEVRERPDGVTVVNDAYNANPDSMRAALRTLAVLGDGSRRRTVAVLGHMAELGDAAREAHMDLGRFVVRLDIDQLVVVGEQAGGIHAGAVLEGSWGSESLHVPDVDAAIALLRAELRPGDVVLVKGSRSAGLEQVAAALLEDAPDAGAAR